MRARILLWAGAVVAVGAAVGLAVHLASVGLDKADKWASVCGMFIGLAGLVLAVYGAVRARSAGSGSGDMRNEFRGNAYGTVIMGRDFHGDTGHGGTGRGGTGRGARRPNPPED
ncbi:hypothetical protein ACQP1W_23195 [Spirillospora sp. CA-255316]